MRPLPAILLLVAAPLLAQQTAVPKDVAAMHPEGKWTVRRADLYRYLVRFYSGQPSARAVLPEYLKRRLVEDEARRRRLSVTSAEVERWLKELDRRVKEQGGGGLGDLRRKMEMTEKELKRRGREWLLREKVARSIFNEKDSTRRKDQPATEDSVILAIDELYRKAPREFDRARLPEGVVARVREVEVTEYEYGRALSYELPALEVYRALLDLVLVEETRLLTGSDGPPTPAELEAQKEWYLKLHKNRLRGQVRDPQNITDEFVKQYLASRGLSLEKVMDNPAFKAQARARGHFRSAQTDERLRSYYAEHRERYGDRLRIARILVAARAQRVVDVARKIRTLEQGKQVANEIWLKLRQGGEFGRLARERSDDPDIVKANGGVVPLWISGETPGYKDSYAMASGLEPGEFSRPFFSAGRGYVIVKLLERDKASGFDAQRERVLADAAEEDYQLWRRRMSQRALKNPELIEDS